jgi:putative two-component system response regulator
MADNRERTACRRALILDDEEISYYMLRRVLKEEGYEVMEAATYDLAAELARTRDPHVVFIDMMMPQITGIEALEMKRRDQTLRRFPDILHSQKELTDEEPAQLSPEIHDILPKDISYDSLKIYVNNLKTFLMKEN